MSEQKPLLPVNFTQIADLFKLGITSNHIKFGQLTVESADNMIIITDNKVYIIHPISQDLEFLEISCDDAIMNPSLNVLAVIKNNKMQLLDLNNKKKLLEYQSRRTIVYWRWINSLEIAYLTANHAFHWKLNKNLSAGKHKQFSNVASGFEAIAHYDISKCRNWMLIQGLGTEKNKITNQFEGSIDLYKLQRANKPGLWWTSSNAYGACFADVKLYDQQHISTCICYTQIEKNKEHKLFVQALNGPKNAKKIKVETTLPLDDIKHHVIKIMPSGNRFRCIYMLTNNRYLYIYDLQTATYIWSSKLNDRIPFVSFSKKEFGRIYLINHLGTMCEVSCNVNNYVPHILNTLKNKDLAVQLSYELKLPGAEKVVEQDFKQLVYRDKWEEAIELALKFEHLRTQENINSFEKAPVALGDNNLPVDLEFYTRLMDKKMTLNKIETLAMCRRCLELQFPEVCDSIRDMIIEGVLTLSIELGNFLAKHKSELGLLVFLKIEEYAKCLEIITNTVPNEENAILLLYYKFLILMKFKDYQQATEILQTVVLVNDEFDSDIVYQKYIILKNELHYPKIVNDWVSKNGLTFRWPKEISLLIAEFAQDELCESVQELEYVSMQNEL